MPGMEVVGIERGYAGLLEGKFIPMTMRSVSDIIQRGGTILRTARCPEFKTKEGQALGIQQLRAAGIEGLIVIGGDGSFMGAKALSEQGFPSIGIPGTIDNDLAYTDFTLGFDTACNTILDAINKIRDTMTSHDRVSIIEVMGRNCGDLALYTGLCGGAEVIIVPEKKMSISTIVGRLSAARDRGKLSGIVVLAEGAGKADRSGGRNLKARQVQHPHQRAGTPAARRLPQPQRPVSRHRLGRARRTSLRAGHRQPYLRHPPQQNLRYGHRGRLRP